MAFLIKFTAVVVVFCCTSSYRPKRERKMHAYSYYICTYVYIDVYVLFSVAINILRSAFPLPVATSKLLAIVNFVNFYCCLKENVIFCQIYKIGKNDVRGICTYVRTSMNT